MHVYNEIMFRAAAKYYAAIGDKTKKKQLDKVLKEYETYVDRMIEEEWLGSDEDGWEDEELPFDWKNLGIHINENELNE